MLTEIGPVEIEVPRDRDGLFEPVIVSKRKRRLGGIDQIVLSLTARGLTIGEDVRCTSMRSIRAKVLQGHGQPDHREGHWRVRRMGLSAAGCDLLW